MSSALGRASGFATLALALWCCLGCDTPKTEYVYRPHFMRADGDSESMMRADGTRMVFVDQPLQTNDHAGTAFGPATQQPLVEYPIINSGMWMPTPEPAPPPPQPIKIREEGERGEIVLRAMTPDHVLSHFVNALREEEYQPLYDCILSDAAKASFEDKGGVDAFAAWCKKHRSQALETLNRMGFGLHNSDVVLVRTGPNTVTARLAPQVGGAFRFREMDLVYDRGRVRLDGLK